MVDRPPEPNLSFSPDRRRVLQLYRPPPMPPISELARPEVKLAGAHPPAAPRPRHSAAADASRGLAGSRMPSALSRDSFPHECTQVSVYVCVCAGTPGCAAERDDAQGCGRTRSSRGAEPRGPPTQPALGDCTNDLDMLSCSTVPSPMGPHGHACLNGRP